MPDTPDVPPPTEVERLRAELQDVTRRLSHADQTLTLIKVALGGVATYEGLVDVSPLAMLVSELVADHERLEQRIENALVYCADAPVAHKVVTNQVIHLLRGASPVPDTIEGIAP